MSKPLYCSLFIFLSSLILAPLIVVALDGKDSPSIIRTDGTLQRKGSNLTSTAVVNARLQGYDYRIRPDGQKGSWNVQTARTTTERPGFIVSLGQPQNRNVLVSPGETDAPNPVIVVVNMFLRRLSHINWKSMECTLQVTFRQEWVDKRLSFEDEADFHEDYINLAHDQRIWTPDTFFQNELNADRRVRDSSVDTLVRLYRDGRVLHSTRITLTLDQRFRFEKYPFDRQEVSLQIASYAYTTNDIVYAWKSSNPIQMKEGFSSGIPNMLVETVVEDFCTSRTNTGTYSCLKSAILLKRVPHFHLTCLYAPSILLIALSWIPFWLHPSTTSTRIMLSGTSLLLLLVLACHVHEDLPTKTALDRWICTSIVFVVFSIIELAFSSNSWAKTPKGCGDRACKNGECLLHPDMVVALNRKTRKQKWFWLGASDNETTAIDLVSRAAFPLSFIVFNIYYWTVVVV